MKSVISIFSRNRPDSFEALVEPHLEHLYRLAYRFTGGREDAEDLVQELLYRLYPRVAILRKVEVLRPWLSRALYNLFVDGTRRQRSDPLALAEDDRALAPEPSGDTPEAEAENDRARRRLTEALQALAPEERVLVSLHDVEGYTLAELEQILEVPLGTLKSRLHRTRKKLRGLLSMEPFAADLRVKG